MTVKNPHQFVRLNSRVLPKHLKFVKDEAKRQTKLQKRPVTEGEVNRTIIDFYMDNNK